MTTLYDISLRFREVAERFLSEDPDEKKQALDELIALQDVKDAKLSNCCKWDRELQARYESVRAERQRLQEMEKEAQKACEDWRAYMAMCLPAGEKWSDGTFKLSYRASEAIEISETVKVPQQYMSVTITEVPNKALIREVIKMGGEVPGAALVKRYNLQVK